MSNNTINKEEVEKFSKIAEEWWNPNGKFKPLHKFNPIRIEYIKNNIIKDFNISSDHKPLKGISILDIGCGGGLLSEPLARLGAEVVGIDASKKNIDIAKHHLKKSNLKIEYYDKSLKNNKNVKKKLREYQKFIKDNFEYVGENFAYEARSIHYNKNKNKKNIYGKASIEDVKELKEEGIETSTIPWIEDKEN